MDMNLNKLWEIAKVREAWCAVVHEVTKSWTRLRDWTELTERQNLESVFKSRDITLPTKVHIVKVHGLPSGHIQLWGLDCKEGRMPKNWYLQTVVLEKTPESSLDFIGLHIHWKDWCWFWSSSILVIWCEQLTHWKNLWCWERLKAKGEEGSRRWNGWIALSIQWTWTWTNSRRSSWPRDWSPVSCMADSLLAETPGKPLYNDLLFFFSNKSTYVSLWNMFPLGLPAMQQWQCKSISPLTLTHSEEVL